MDDRRQHAPHRIAVQDALVEAGGPLVRVDLEDVGHARQMRQLGRHPRRGRQREDLDPIGLGLARRPRQVHRRLERGQADGGQILRAPGARRRPRRDHEIVRGAERRHGGSGPGHVDHRQCPDAVHLLVGRPRRTRRPAPASVRRRPWPPHPARRGSPRRPAGPAARSRRRRGRCGTARPGARDRGGSRPAAHRRPAERGARRDRPPGAGPPGAWRSRRQLRDLGPAQLESHLRPGAS